MDRSRTLTWTELRVGAVMLVSLAILAVTILYIGGSGAAPFARKYDIKSLMTDVNGLKTGAPVRVGGVEVGSVTSVNLGGPADAGLVEVVMRLDRRVQSRVTTDSQATLGTLGLLGEKAVDISPSRSGQPIDDGGFVAAASEDPFKGLLSNASDSTAYLRRILARVDAGEGLLGKALRDNELYDRMTDVSRRLQALLTQLESNKSPLGRLAHDEEMSAQMASSVRSIEAVASRLDAGQGVLGALSRDQELSKDVKTLAGSLSELASRIEKGQGTVGRLFSEDSFYEKLDRLTERVDKLLSELEGGQGSAGRLLRDPELYADTSAAAKELRQLLGDIRRDPHKYLRVKLSLF